MLSSCFAREVFFLDASAASAPEEHDVYSCMLINSCAPEERDVLVAIGLHVAPDGAMNQGVLRGYKHVAPLEQEPAGRNNFSGIAAQRFVHRSRWENNVNAQWE